MRWNGSTALLTASLGAMVWGGCRESGADVRGVKVDGSSTVAPMSMIAAEMMMADSPVQVTVGISGTGGGFKRLLDPNASLRTDINNASRPISPHEIEAAEKLGVGFIELPIALDGIAVTVNRENTFCDHLTTTELRRIWTPGSAIHNWRDIRRGFPDLLLKLYGPGSDSGTFDYFTEVINGKEKHCRSDYMMSEDDNTLVQGVSGDAGGLAFFGFAYYSANADKLKLLAIESGYGAILPSEKTIRDGSYRPLSRPLFLYVNASSATAEPVAQFVDFYLTHLEKIASHPKAGYIPLPAALQAPVRERFRKRITGSAFVGRAASSGPADLAALYGH